MLWANANNMPLLRNFDSFRVITSTNRTLLKGLDDKTDFSVALLDARAADFASCVSHPTEFDPSSLLFWEWRPPI